MSGRGFGLGSPGVALPVGRAGRGSVGHFFPPHVAIVGQRGVGVDRVAPQAVHCVGVGLVARARSDAEEPRFGVDCPQATIIAELHPADVVTDGLGLPAGHGGNEHRQVGLAARRWEGCRNVLRLAFGAGELEDQHVLREPAVVAGHHRGDA